MQSEKQQRRLSTILAADVAGYSRMMANDEETTLRTLKAFRGVTDGLIARHEGRIFNTAGDSVLAEFGSAVEAVRCAISIQEDLRVRNEQLDPARRMQFRIGINVGDVLVEGGNLYGDGVNVAARLEGVAPPGGICISGSTFALVKNKLSYGFEDIGPQAVKNIPEPVPAFRLVHGAAPAVSSPAAGPARAPRRRVLIAAGAGTLAIAAAVAWFALRAPQEEPPQAGEPPVLQPGAAELERMKPLVGMAVHAVAQINGKPFTVALGAGGVAEAEIKDVPAPGAVFRDRGRWWVTARQALCWKFPRFAQGEMRCRRLERAGEAYRGIPREPQFGAWTIKR